MTRVRFKPVKTPPPQMPAFEDEGALEARRLQRSGLKDVMWVAIGLAAILIAGMIYEANQGADRRAARQRAEAVVRSAAPVPYSAFQTPQRYPTVEEMQAEAVVREARALAAANAAANASDPALNHQLAQPVAPAYSPTPPSPFGAQAGAPGALAGAAPVAPAAPPAGAAPSGPPR